MISERRRLQCFHIWFGVIVHATISKRRRLHWFILSMPRFVRCALIRKMNHGEVAATKRPLQTTKGQGNGGRKTKRDSCMRSYMQIKFIEQLITIRLAP